jgi:hypothetical protein
MSRELQNTAHALDVSFQKADLLLHDYRQRICNVAVTRLQGLRVRAAGDQMRSAKLFTRHLQKEQPMAFGNSVDLLQILNVAKSARACLA